jgi:two-component system, OmpR family, response regulator RegX3
MLRKEGFEVTVCPTGPDALEAFDRNGAESAQVSGYTV